MKWSQPAPEPDFVIALTDDELARGDLLLARVVDFARLLWELGLDVGPGRVVEMARGLDLVNVGSRDDLYMYLKVTLVSKHEQQPIFDAAFEYFWRSSSAGEHYGSLPEEQRERVRRNLALPMHRQTDDRQERTQRFGIRAHEQQRHPHSRLAQARRQKRNEDNDELDRRNTYGAEEVLRRKDFENFTWDELQEARELMSRMRWRLGQRNTRRLRPARRGKKLDLRRTFRKSLRAGGEPIELARRRIRRKPRPLVIICDISGSMSLYSRLLLHFVHTVSNGLDQVETFVFATRLTRITRALARRDVDEAIHDVTRSVQDWSGGTRIGESLREFNFRWARRVLGRGAVALIISDGWDRGDVRILATEMARLQRNCHRLIWLNPLLGQDDYRPVTAGMRAALPYIDDFLPANNLDSLVALGRALESVDDRRAPSRGQRQAGRSIPSASSSP
ncbi:MAG TPA: VWA domain-containing protein [Ktedonobacterales bacterium]|nr:VWA domain-containing protein [Ktedonobacterales bacterium]